MAWPVIASTATTLAAFLPLMFWPGVVGEFMKYLPLTLIATLTSSLVMALIFVPTLGAVFGKSGGTADPETMKALAASEHGNLDEVKGWTGRYVSVLGFALRHPGKVAFVAVLRSEEHTSELQSLMRISYAVFCLKKNKAHKS